MRRFQRFASLLKRMSLWELREHRIVRHMKLVEARRDIAIAKRRDVMITVCTTFVNKLSKRHKKSLRKAYNQLSKSLHLTTSQTTIKSRRPLAATIC